ncbi:DISARM system SNF2-like helicase DrmD, partial [Myxococcota bacterium]|nr:DISARM system SNF2-like helicase DrmD [Myxococcota bacterium]
MSDIAAPEQGQMVQVRNLFWFVQDVQEGSISADVPPMHKVRLESLNDDTLGQTMEVIWEHEVAPEVYSTIETPSIDTMDSLARLESFLLASRWSTTSIVQRLPLQAPFRGAIKIEDFQLEPVVRAIEMPRVNLLIADDVGLGKTIEAGMVMQELIARQRVRKVLIVCPASLQQQWAEEMLNKFALRFEVVNSDYLKRLRREYGNHVNPWASFPRLITSMDFLKRERPLEDFLNSLNKQHGLRDWDLLIVDEAHNVAPSGRKSYIRDSDRTQMMRQIINHFEHRLFLTATPHNGYTESFTALLELLDPLRFSRSPVLPKDHLRAVMIRRIKDQMVDALGRRSFAKRIVESMSPVKLSDKEATLYSVLDQYIALRMSRSSGRSRLPIRFALTMLKKRLLSSLEAFLKSLNVHAGHLAPSTSGDGSLKVVESLARRSQEDFSDDEEKDAVDDSLMVESTGFFDTTDEERRMVERMIESTRILVEKPDSKTTSLIKWIEENLNPEGGWNHERLLVFTEYKDTLEYLRDQLRMKGWEKRVAVLYGGMPEKERESIKAAFQADPAITPVRILLATDTASEGLNLQRYCRHLLHWEIPWNPNRMEQRNGRIDRHGQPAPEVFCRHFVFENYADQEFLNVIIEKVRTQRQDLGAVGDVIAEQVEQALLGERQTIAEPADRTSAMREELKADLITQERIHELRRAVDHAREQWHLTPENLRMVLEEGLLLSGSQPLKQMEGDPDCWLLPSLPPSWADCRPFIQTPDGARYKLVFTEEASHDRPDTRLIHLDHPLMKRALGVFRANLWSTGLHETHKLARSSVKVLSDRDLKSPVVILFGRMLTVGIHGQKIHEELLLVGGDFEQERIIDISQEELDRLFHKPGKQASLEGILPLLRRFWPHH